MPVKPLLKIWKMPPTAVQYTVSDLGSLKRVIICDRGLESKPG
jgi:hypothetical protein